MTTLFLDFASHRKSVALVDDVKTISLEPIDDHADESALLPIIEGMMKKDAKVDRIAAVTGPGGFMSLRVGLAIANALAWSLKIPAAGIHLSDLWSARVTSEKNFAWVHSTKKELIFLRGFGELKEVWPEPTLFSLSDFHLPLTADRFPLFFVGELIESQAQALPSLKRIDALAPLEDVLPKILNALAYEKKEVMPWYGRGA